MKRENVNRSLLGISQRYLAMLLKVSREQLALYETGKRNLPAKASIILADILSHMNPCSNVKYLVPKDDAYIDALKIRLKFLLSENEYQILKVSKNKVVLDKKYAKQLKTLQVANYLSQHPAGKGDLDAKLLKVIGKEASKKIDMKERLRLFENDIKLEKLEFEKSLLTFKLAELNAT